MLEIPTLTAGQTERFWAKVEKCENGCWLWIGYSNLTLGKAKPFWKIWSVRYSARRVSYALARPGPVPPRMYISCGNDLCINPDHLTGRRPYDPWKMSAKNWSKVPTPVELAESLKRGQAVSGNLYPEPPGTSEQIPPCICGGCNESLGE